MTQRATEVMLNEACIVYHELHRPADIPAMRAALEAALAAAPEHPAVEMLREIQWSCLDEMEDETCPVCNRYRHNSWFDGHSVPVGHATNCRLAALIKEP